MRKRLDISGQSYGKLTVVKEVEQHGTKRRWLCKCKCENYTVVLMDSLRSGNTRSCGCLKPERAAEVNTRDLAGQTFNKLTVIKRLGTHPTTKSALWLCRCDCNEYTKVTTTNLVSGNAKSCGCSRKSSLSYWVLGFLWGSARFSGDYFLIQNSDKKLLLKVKRITGIQNKIFNTVTDSRKKSYRVKMRIDNEYVQYMIKNGYVGRQGNLERSAPRLFRRLDEHNFLKGYFYTHYSYDRVRTQPRLRFYASYQLLDMLNQHLHIYLGTTIKKIADHSGSDVCKILYYQSKKEVPKIKEYMELKERKT
ncbi:hypothetical protein [Virgibacillus pantothenticus]|uniref:hypothetical protein n=1 Tax=Virgibacillus pantothenticus TaxID=1473 RepID=UPI000984E9E8|nr:hypothetical protein [Virgibacillus pantothenticus]